LASLAHAAMDPLQLSLYNHGENLALGCERPLTQESLDCVVHLGGLEPLTPGPESEIM
jgi:hypothetical protein